MKKPAEMTKPLEMRKPVEMTKPVEKTKPVYMTQVPTVILRGALRRSRRIHGLSRCLPTLACARYHDRTERSKTAQNQISPFGRNHKAGRNDTTANRQSARIRSAQSLKFVRPGPTRGRPGRALEATAPPASTCGFGPPGLLGSGPRGKAKAHAVVAVVARALGAVRTTRAPGVAGPSAAAQSAVGRVHSPFRVKLRLTQSQSAIRPTIQNILDTHSKHIRHPQLANILDTHS